MSVSLNSQIEYFLVANPTLSDEYFGGILPKEKLVEAFYDDFNFRRYILDAMAEAERIKKEDDLCRIGLL